MKAAWLKRQIRKQRRRLMEGGEEEVDLSSLVALGTLGALESVLNRRERRLAAMQAWLSKEER